MFKNGFGTKIPTQIKILQRSIKKNTKIFQVAGRSRSLPGQVLSGGTHDGIDRSKGGRKVSKDIGIDDRFNGTKMSIHGLDTGLWIIQQPFFFSFFYPRYWKTECSS